ncbi:MAG: DNA-3-methyladenine glycosylase [Actinomycetia bacterium]|nr:DNA-3-methyladenine glycosylase [Actinomycetes bacterium]MCP4963257.1 DNA-3-methyladenine glycosylase [Actinomycetes bacterium]
MPVDRAALGRDAREVAPYLLNKVVGHGAVTGRIVEVEAYRGSDDPGSHAYRGPTPRTQVMFGSAGFAYVYFTYGMYWCMNVVVGPEGTASAVLIRALAPIGGIDTMFERRPKAHKTKDLCSGPAKLCQALDVDGRFDGHDLAEDPLLLLDDGTPPPAEPSVSARIGLSRGLDLPWRWYVSGDPNVSR